MTRRGFLTALTATVTSNRVTAQAKGFHLTGTISGEHVEGGYFHIGEDFVMATPITSPLFPLLEKLVGVNVEVTIHPTA